MFAELKRIDPDVRAVAMAAGDPGEWIGRCKDLGFAGWLPKPFTLQELADILKTAAAAA